MPTPNLESADLSVDEPAPEPELISLRSTLPPISKSQLLETLSNFPSYDTEIELPSHPRGEAEPGADGINRLESIENAADTTAKAELSSPGVPRQVTADLPAEGRTIDIAFFPTRSMLPALTALALVSAGWFMGVMPLLPPLWQSWEAYASIPGAVGCFVLIQWIFGVIGGGYRLTDTQLIRVFAGPVANPEPIDLATIRGVKAESNLLEMCLAVGRVRIAFERDVQPELVLGPIGCPRRRAIKIEQAAEAARAASVVGARLAA